MRFCESKTKDWEESFFNEKWLFHVANCKKEIVKRYPKYNKTNINIEARLEELNEIESYFQAVLDLLAKDPFKKEKKEICVHRKNILAVLGSSILFS